MRTIKNFALWSAVFSLMPNPKCGPFDLRSLRQDSVRRGLLARSMARLLGVADGEEAFAAALLQDMAVPLLAKELAAEYRVLLEGREGGRRRLSDLERKHFGWHHGQAAAAMATQWKLPADFAALIESHTAIDRLQSPDPVQPLVAAVRLSAVARDERRNLVRGDPIRRSLSTFAAGRRTGYVGIVGRPGRGVCRLCAGAECPARANRWPSRLPS